MSIGLNAVPTFLRGRRDRLCGHPELGVLNGDLATVTGVDSVSGTVEVRLDRHPETVTLPAWYISGHVDNGYALRARADLLSQRSTEGSSVSTNSLKLR